MVVIDDIDHFMPYCGVRNAMEFSHTVRDVINHAETAFLFIGYNHLGKKASTTGNLGKFLFNDASDIFSLSSGEPFLYDAVNNRAEVYGVEAKIVK